MRWTLVLTLLFAAGCTVTRYYETAPLKKQMLKVQKLLGEDRQKVAQDFQEKTEFVQLVEDAEIKNAYEQLKTSHGLAKSQSQTVEQNVQQMLSELGNKKKITSDDPTFKKVSAFEVSSKEQIDALNHSYAAYQKASQSINEIAAEKRIFWINPKEYSPKLRAAIQDISKQCDDMDKEMASAKKLVSKDDARRHELLNRMTADLQGFRVLRDELVAFSNAFERATKGKEKFLVTQDHPQTKLFSSLDEIRKKGEALVKSFNTKAQELN